MSAGALGFPAWSPIPPATRFGGALGLNDVRIRINGRHGDDLRGAGFSTKAGQPSAEVCP
jgi:hypothetical protein